MSDLPRYCFKGYNGYDLDWNPLLIFVDERTNIDFDVPDYKQKETWIVGTVYCAWHISHHTGYSIEDDPPG